MKNNGKDSNKSNNGFIPNSFKFISTCIKTASYGVRSASASVAASISGDAHDHKDQVLWACFDRLELAPSSFKQFSFLQMQPLPVKSEGLEGFRPAHPLLLVVACDNLKTPGTSQNGRDGVVRDGYSDTQAENLVISPTAVRFYSLRSHSYVHALRFRSSVYMVRCSPQIVAVGLAAQIRCFDALTLENKFSVLTYPVPQLGGQGMVGVNIGYGPMAVGPRWLAYASNNLLLSNTGRLSPQSLTPPGVSPSTSPSNGNLVARYAMESSKHLANGLINLGDMGYKTLSKYCQEFMPDGSSSPVSSHASWKGSRFASHSSETEMAGVVVVKDFVSRAVVSQFRAHTSPISALCFDPSGTLLVTASIYGNNINIFRIMPSYSRNGYQSNDWSSSHVHLFKLHRGMTSAVIQDICFSHCSQWVSIISSKGTCHIFVLAPFGGETVLKLQNPDTKGPILSPVLPLPWWFCPDFTINKQPFSVAPPPPVTLSVVSRIKNSNSGWINTVSTVTSVAGKVSIPCGAIAAIFHSSVTQDAQPTHSNVHALEHLLVYTPSGHLVQYKLLPSMGGEPIESASRLESGPSAHIQDEDLQVKVEPVQWWDVCRRIDWPEREESVSGNTLCRPEAAHMTIDTSDCEDSDVANNGLVKSHERSKFYFSNAEVHISSGRMPVWQKSEMSFFVMDSLEAGEKNLPEDHTGGEIEIEKFPLQEVEIKQKDSLPIIDHFHGIHSDWADRGLVMGRCSSSSSNSHGAEEKLSEDAVVSCSKLAAPGSVEKANIGASHFSDGPITTVKMSNSVRAMEVPKLSSNHCKSRMDIHDEEAIHESLDFKQNFQEGYSKASADCLESTEVVNNVDYSNYCDREKSEEVDDNDDMFGGVFDFSEEGRYMKLLTLSKISLSS
ncbi:Autophagy-related protein like [Quillaja saponaria]|uniref:Autophagy-related protein like n=1 Tax=Quillaja saponaria TaxID=32244 RepID=A0AAD7Q201_QUISA|nr:Autophagy-related protein like [Quillaja saponaria]